MKKISLLIFLFLSIADAKSQGVFEKKITFSRQDSLRGSITKERIWWDLIYYHLDIKINPKKNILKGQTK